MLKNWMRRLGLAGIAVLALGIGRVAMAEDFPFLCATDATQLTAFRVLPCDTCGAERIFGAVIIEGVGNESTMRVSVWDSEDGKAWVVKGSVETGLFGTKRKHLLAWINKSDPTQSFVDFQVAGARKDPGLGQAWQKATCRQE